MKLAAATALVLASTSLALAQGAPPPAPPPPPPVPVVAGGPVVVVSPAPVIVTQPAPAPVAAAPGSGPSTAPQTHDWKDVNNINGQLVKVGETNDYLKSYKRWNISTNPIGMMLGYYGLSVSYGINNNIAIRGDVNYINFLDDDERVGVELGVGVPIYFRRTYQGLFLEPGFVSMTFSDDYYCGDCSASGMEKTTTTTFGPQMLVGWHWTWDSGLNFALAAGVGRDWATKETKNYDEDVFPNGYMRFGYAF